MPNEMPAQQAEHGHAAGGTPDNTDWLLVDAGGADAAALAEASTQPAVQQYAPTPVTHRPLRSEMPTEPAADGETQGQDIADAVARGERQGHWAIAALFLGDAASLTAAFVVGRLSHAFYYHEPLAHVFLDWWGAARSVNMLLFPLLASIAVATFALRGHYATRKGFWDELGEVIQVFTIFTALNAAFAFSGKWPLSRLWLFSTWALAFLLVPLTRTLLRWLLRRVWGWSRPYVLIGTGENAAETVRAFVSEPLLGYALKAVLVPRGAPALAPGFPQTVPVLDLGEDPLATLMRLGRPQAVLALEPEQWGLQRQLARTLGLSYPRLTIAPALRGLPLFGLESMHFFSHEVLMLRVRDNLNQPGARLLKRGFDLLAASTLVLLLSPVLLLIAALIRREDGGSVLYAQKRVGRHGRPFACYKFRSMVIDAKEKLESYLRTHPEARAEYERNFKLRNDPRITRIGRFLRRTSLDELPQLFNVLRGSMSLVGPRPVTACELENYYRESSRLYTSVLPGITGLWQISGRSDTTYNQRIYFDEWYVRNWSLWYDVVILVRTIRVLLRQDGAY